MKAKNWFSRRQRRLIGNFCGQSEEDFCDPGRTARQFGEVARSFIRTSFGNCVRQETLQGNWHDIVGKRLAPHCSPEKIERGVLTICAGSDVAAQELNMGKNEILRAVRLLPGLPTIRSLRVIRRD
jgi:hypothetical protein